MTQLMMEYTPAPPFDSCTPETAGKPIVDSLMQFGQPLLGAFATQTMDTANQLNLGS